MRLKRKINSDNLQILGKEATNAAVIIEDNKNDPCTTEQFHYLVQFFQKFYREHEKENQSIKSELKYIKNQLAIPNRRLLLTSTVPNQNLKIAPVLGLVVSSDYLMFSDEEKVSLSKKLYFKPF